MPKKKIQKNQILNWAAKMDNRANDEVLNVNPNEKGIVFGYLENADLYDTKALKNRKGNQDLCGGIVNSSLSGVSYIDIVSSGSVAGTTLGFSNLPALQTAIFDYPTTVFIPDENIALHSANIRIRETVPAASFPAFKTAKTYEDPARVRAWVFELDQEPFPSSGVGGMSGTRAAPDNIYHEIKINGSFNNPPYPQFLDQTASEPYGSTPIGVGEGSTTFDIAKYSGTAAYISEEKTVDVSFDAPVWINSGTVYGIRWEKEDSDRTLSFKTIYATTTPELDEKSILATTFNFGGGTPQSYAIRPWNGNLSTKTWVYGDVLKYSGVDFLNPDYYTADRQFQCPLELGRTPLLSTSTTAEPSMTSARGASATADFGQVFTLPTTNTIFYGTYFWSTFYQDMANLDFPYTGDKNIGIRTSLWSIDAITGALADGDYKVTQKTLLATGSGNYVFDSDDRDSLGVTNDPTTGKPNYRLNKVYTMFDNPVQLSGDGTANQHLMSFGFYDYDTGADLTDTFTNQAGFGGLIGTWASPMCVGIEGQTEPAYGGNYLVDYSGVGIYAHPSGVYTDNNWYPTPVHFDLSCGLITVASGNAIQGIYDYRVGENRTSQIVYAQSGDLKYFDYDSPHKDNHTTIYTGGSGTNNALWSFESYDDLMFAHQYSQISGQAWDQVQSSTQEHGLRPSGNVIGVSGTAAGSIPSGVPFSIYVSANYSSGGHRASDKYAFPSGIVSGDIKVTGNFLQVSGLADQFTLDMPANHMYIWTTAATGTSLYLANIYPTPSTTGTVLNYPLTSGVDVVYINRLADIDNDSSISTVTNYDNNYMFSQVDTPKFKKMKVFYDYVIGIGDPDFPSRMHYSEQFSPEIWGESFNYHGFVDVDKDNGSPLTSCERLREYLILFKKNSCYRVEFLGSNSEPFAINQISSKIGSLGAFGTIAVGDAVYGLCQYGVFMTNGASINIISDAIDPYFRDLDHEDLTFATAVHDMHEDKIVWSISNDNQSSDLNKGIMLNYKEKSFSVRKGGMWNAAATINDDDGFDILLGGTVNGQIQTLEVANVDEDTLFNDGDGASDDRAIQLVAKTPWLSVGDSQIQKDFKYVDMNIENTNVEAQLAVEVFFNENDDDSYYTRYISLNGNNPDKRVHLGGKAKTLKMKFYNVGNPATVKIKSLNLYFAPISIDDAL